ncbi:MAG: carbohydrate binding family 9 domain-containing protein, partial [Chitinophagales bacterium]
MKRQLLYLFIPFLLTYLPLQAQSASETEADTIPKISEEKRIYTTKRIEGESPIIDGKFDEACWETVEWTGDYVQWKPYNAKAPTAETKFKVLYDDKYIYFAYRCFDDPEKIVRRMSRRDGFEGDWVEINIDSYFDKQTAFSFTISVSGVKGDEAVTNNGNNWDGSWDPIWYTKTAIDDKGWTAEVKIPLSQLRFANKDVQVWGLQSTRRVFRAEERSTWQFVPQNESGWVHRFGELHGLEGIKPQKQIELEPYVLAQAETFEKEEGNPFATGSDSGIDVGLNGKIGVTSDLTLDFT